jgi:hypothetical protein
LLRTSKRTSKSEFENIERLVRRSWSMGLEMKLQLVTKASSEGWATIMAEREADVEISKIGGWVISAFSDLLLYFPKSFCAV